MFVRRWVCVGFINADFDSVYFQRRGTAGGGGVVSKYVVREKSHEMIGCLEGEDVSLGCVRFFRLSGQT